VKFCLFEDNNHNNDGGIANTRRSYFEVYDSTFKNNSGNKGGIVLTSYCYTSYRDSVFINSKGWMGSVLYLQYSSAEIHNCTFDGAQLSNNDEKGGTVYIDGGNAIIIVG
jgi:hypothetical protein